MVFLIVCINLNKLVLVHSFIISKEAFSIYIYLFFRYLSIFHYFVRVCAWIHKLDYLCVCSCGRVCEKRFLYILIIKVCV